MVWNKNILLTPFLICIICTLYLYGQDSSKIAVEIIPNSNDSVGERLIYNTKEFIRESHLFRLTTKEEPRIQIRITTMPKYDDVPSVSSIYTIIWAVTDTWIQKESQILPPLYLDHTLGFCGSKVIKSSAEQIVAQTDQIIDDFGIRWLLVEEE